MLRADDLLKQRTHSGNYGCPIHISIRACKRLFKEAGLTPEPEAVGTLGDILENFALSLLSARNGPGITRSELKQLLREVIN